MNKSAEMDKIAIDVWVSWNASMVRRIKSQAEGFHKIFGNLRRELSTIVPKCAMQTTIAAIKIFYHFFFLEEMYLNYPLLQIGWDSD